MLQETALNNGVSAMPTFLFFKNKQKVDSLRGADQDALKAKIIQWYGDGDDDESADGPSVPGYVSSWIRIMTLAEWGETEI